VGPVFYVTSAVVLLATLLAITRRNAVHALLYLVVSLLGTALALFLLGAPFAAALEVIIYAGAIIVLFLFAVMMLDLGREGVAREGRLLRPRTWAGPALLAAALGALLVVVLARPQGLPPGFARPLGPEAVGRALLGPYLIGVELASLLLLAGLVGAYHLSRPRRGEAEP